ncbi:MAG: PAS domain S-box protein [Nannocystaceae bacterium]|nr:PAS domain S-box protein [bacterium]
MTRDRQQDPTLDAVPGLTLRMLSTLRESVLLTGPDLDEGPRILYANDAFWRMSGYTPGELIGQTPRVLQGPKTDRALLLRLRSDLEAGRPFEGRAINYRKDGSEYHVSWYIEPVRAASGAVEYYIAVQRDITHTVRSEAELNSVLSALRASPEGLLFLDEAGKIIRANPAAEELCRVSADAMVGRTLPELFDPDDLSVSDDGRWEVRIDDPNLPATRRVELRRIGRDGGDTFWAASDQTERRRLDALANAVNVVQQTGYVFAGIRHELGNPINSVKTALAVLQKHGATFSEDKRADYYDRMMQELVRIDFLLTALRSYNAHESVRVEVFDVNTHIEDFLRVARASPSAADLQWHPSQRPLLVRGDPRGLYQVLLNLVKNAGDAVADVSGPRIVLSTRDKGDTAEVIVEDNGVGMTPDQLDSIGRPFATSKPQGTGLGVCVSQRILAGMQGLLDFESTPSEGTRARIELPRAQRAT